MPTDDVLGGDGGLSVSGDSQGDVAGDAGIGGDSSSGDVAGGSGNDSASGGDRSDASSDSDNGGDGPARSMGKGDALTQAAQKAYRTLTKPEPAKAAQPRNERGQFDKNGNRIPQDGKPQEKQTAAPVADPNKPAAQPGQLDPDRVPDSWTNEAKALWQNLPPRVRQEVNKREQDYRNGHARLNQTIESQKPYMAFMQNLDKAAEPYLAGWQSKGVDVGTMMRDATTLMGVLHFGDNNQKLEAVRQLVKVFGVNIPRRTADGQPVQDAPAAVPNAAPAVDPALLNTVQQLQQRAQRDDQIRMQEQQRQQQAAQVSVQRDVDAFVANPANEHFNLVYEKMAQLLERGLAKDLTDAYDQAVWSTPAARTAMQNKQRKAEIDEANRIAVEARRAAGVRTGGKPADFQPASVQQTGNKRNDTITNAVRQFVSKTGR